MRLLCDWWAAHGELSVMHAWAAAQQVCNPSPPSSLCGRDWHTSSEEEVEDEDEGGEGVELDELPGGNGQDRRRSISLGGE